MSSRDHFSPSSSQLSFHSAKSSGGRSSVPFNPRDPVLSVIALFNYASRSDEELNFSEGDHLEIIGAVQGNWCKARPAGKHYQVGFIPTAYVATPGSLESRPWYCFMADRVDVERNLLTSVNSEGSFLIRRSSAGSHIGFVLSVRYHGTVKHYLIAGGAEKKNFCINPSAKFPTLDHLIDYYQKNLTSEVVQLGHPGVMLEAPPVVGLSHEMSDRWEIPRHMIQLDKKLGNGNFGEVYKGIFNHSLKVAVKTLKQGNLAKGEFLKEAETMKKLIHPKVVQLFGVCTREDPFYIITELMPNGDLLDYLQKGKGARFRTHDLINICTQVACGMAFLEYKKFVHRDLAARNVLVGDANNCKVADFGFARLTQSDLYVATMKDVKLPVKWTAPEALRRKEFTTKSDVWAFGVLLYETIEKGKKPYPQLSNSAVYNELQRGYRMPKSEMPNCPDRLYGMMLCCWDASPDRRPTFAQLYSSLENFFD